VYVDHFNIFDGRLHAFKEKAEAVVFASKKIELDVNADKKKRKMVKSRDQNAERNHNL